MVTDPISDLLTRIRNASMVSKPNVSIPHSNFKFELAKLLKNEGYVSDVKISGDGVKKSIDIDMKYSDEGNSVISGMNRFCLLYTSPSPRDATLSRMPSSA